jgi:hypothetical protein
MIVDPDTVLARLFIDPRVVELYTDHSLAMAVLARRALARGGTFAWGVATRRGVSAR